MMRRKDREILDSELIDIILNNAEVCRIAFSSGDQPYVVPLSFGYKERDLFFHSAPKGRKLEAIAANPRVCFEVEHGVTLVRAGKACDFTFHFTSVIGFGRAALVTDPAQKAAGLNIIVSHYGGEAREYSLQELDRLAVVKVEIDEMTCKKSPNP